MNRQEFARVQVGEAGGTTKGGGSYFDPPSLTIAKRSLAALGRLAGAAATFDRPVLDAHCGGALAALPALLAAGLLRHTGLLDRAKAAFYSLESRLLMLAFMALARIRSPEALLKTSPGEWGLLLGLDRGPHPKTVRTHLARMADGAA
ncbi:MAG: putative transposase [Lentisphaeria bacterium]